MAEPQSPGGPASPSAALEQLVAEADTGGRKPTGFAAWVLLVVAVAWSLFQLWYASPLPFTFGFLILNDTEARSLHLSFALFLAFTAFPAFKRSARDRVPAHDWLIGLFGVFCGGYLLLFYRELALRPGLPNALDVAAAIAGMVLLLEATRRSLGPPLAVIAIVFLIFTFAGPWMPDVISHKGASFSRVISHQWLTTEGVFGVALGVSTSFVFLYVLFGSLLDKAGAGNYMMQVSLALLGHLKGGPAKVAVVSSALNGVISGSSISNVVSGGIFTIPMMRRTGFSAVKAGAVETASSINGQIMPPVMGAAAFLMVEYVGIPYNEIVKHALLPAVISYIALFYIVHLEAMKLDTPPLKRAVERTLAQRLFRISATVTGILVLSMLVYYGIGWTKDVFGAAAGWIVGGAMVAVYVALLRYAAKFPDLEMDDPNAPLLHLPDTWPTVRTGLHFLIPIVVLLWCLMVELLSPGLAAFWATATMIAILATQRPIIAWFRGGRALSAAFGQGLIELVDGLALGAHNMVSIGVATACAGIVVGTVTLTGMGLMMTDLVELISGGNVIVMLLLTAFISLILGMGVPTTANYILIATLIAPVVVELGAEGGLVIPLIAVHLFVFYFGIMADITPPVGLAAYAAAAISGADPIKTGVQGAIYSLRTAILPFLFIYNPQLLLIGVGNWFEALLVIAGATVAMMLFAAATMNYFLVKSRAWETAALLLVTFTLFRPGFWMDMIYGPYVDSPPARMFELAAGLRVDDRLAFVIEGQDLNGADVRRVVTLRLDPGASGEARLAKAGLTLRRAGDAVQVTGVRLGSPAKKAGIEIGWKVTAVKEPAPRPSKFLLYIPALALLGLVIAAQLARRRRHAAVA
ncbi:MAG: TRAP transporter fused permease subunit [Acidimicrobiia bacterium]|nr:TRAP transporter fused permease subunit [Acidimicrobiia bacterium]